MYPTKNMLPLTYNESVTLGLCLYFGVAILTFVFHACYKHQKVYDERSIVSESEHVHCQVYCCSLLLALGWPIHFTWIFLYVGPCWPFRCCASRKLKPCLEEKVHNPLTCGGDSNLCTSNGLWHFKQ